MVLFPWLAWDLLTALKLSRSIVSNHMEHASVRPLDFAGSKLAVGLVMSQYCMADYVMLAQAFQSTPAGYPPHAWQPAYAHLCHSHNYAKIQDLQLD
jgi:hypothetical protein